MFSYTELVAAGPHSTGIKLDLLVVTIIFIIHACMVICILLKNKLSVIEKFKLVGLPMSVMFGGLALAVTMRLNA